MMELRALILEEDDVTLSLIAAQLREEGFTQVMAAEPNGVVDFVNNHKVDICLIASRYKGCDGFELARKLREQSGAGVILLGDSDDELDTVLALEMGADDYVVKPPRPRELCARIRTILRRTVVTPATESGARPLPTSYLRRIDDIEICGVLRCVSVRGRSVDLTALEFDVLMALAVNTNTILSRDKIIAAVRGSDWAINERSVDGIISRLRRKLFEDEDGNQRIKTVHGRGYMLIEAQMADL